MPYSKEALTPRSSAAAVVARSRASHHESLPGSGSGSGSNSNASSSTSAAPLIPFKPGQTSLRQQMVLTEEEYTDCLSSIIKRDFFPKLDRLKAENAYLAALEDGDQLHIQKALRKLLRIDASENAKERSTVSKGKRKSVNDPPTAPRSWAFQDATPVAASPRRRGEWDDTPAAYGNTVFDPTAASTASVSTSATPYAHTDRLDSESEENISSGAQPNVSHLSLAEFQKQYTSEDNASFGQILDQENQNRKRKFLLAYRKEQEVNERRIRARAKEVQEAERGKRLALQNEDAPKLLENSDDAKLLIGSADRSATAQSRIADNDTTLNTTGTASPPSSETAAAAAAGGGKPKYVLRNALMFGPDANVDTIRSEFSTPHSHSHSHSASQAESTASAPKINLRALDFSTGEDGSARELNEGSVSPTNSRIDEAIRGGKHGLSGSSVTDEVETPKVNGYGFVTPYSTPHPSTSSETGIDAGTSTITQDVHSRLLDRLSKTYSGLSSSASGTGDNGSSSSRQFFLPPVQKREALAHRLAATPTTTSRSRSRQSDTTPTLSEGGDATPYGQQKYTGVQLRSDANASGNPGFRLPAASNSSSRQSSSGSSRRTRLTKQQLTPAGRALLARTSRVSSTPLLGAAGGASSSPRTVLPPKSRLDQRRWSPTPSPSPRPQRPN